MRNRFTNTNYTSEPGRQVEFRSTNAIFLSGIQGMSITGSIDFYNSDQYHVNARNSHLIFSSSAGFVAVSGGFNTYGNIYASGTHTLTGSLNIFDFIYFQSNRPHHVRAVNSHLILSSSAGSLITVSGNANILGEVAATGNTHILSGTLRTDISGTAGTTLLAFLRDRGALCDLTIKASGSAATPNLVATVQIRAGAGDNLKLSANAADEPLIFLTSSNTRVGILTHSPQDTFDVNGNIRVNYQLHATGSHLVLTSSAGSTVALSASLKASGSHTLTGTLDVTGDIEAEGGYKIVLEAAHRINAAANTRYEMSGTDSVVAGGSHKFYWIAPFAGSIIGLSAVEKFLQSSATPVTFSASINATPTASAILILSASKASGSTTFAKDAVSFQVGDRLGVYMATITGHTTTTDYKCWLTIEM